MTGRPVELTAPAVRAQRGRKFAVVLAVVSLLVLGLAIGSRIARRQTVAEPTTVTITTSSGDKAAPGNSTSPALVGFQRTREGAVTAASAYVSELDGSAILDSSRLRRVVRTIAATSAQSQLATAYAQVAAQAKQQLGVDTFPRPVLLLRAAPIGYRVDRFDRFSARVSIWRVGIVGSGATVDPQQSWRTETVSLVWERGDWKVESFASSPGPTPPLKTSVADQPGYLFKAIPRFEEFTRADP